jgi:phosphoglucosamine mutase
MISASHNPYQDNGIKLFGPDGYKLSDDVEAAIEARMNGGLDDQLAQPADLGRALRLEDAQGRYIEFAKQTFPRGSRLDGLKVVIDCANGAAYRVAPTVLWELGADVIAVGNEPDGFNINRGCGSTDTSFMQEQVVLHGADIGIALDGDADRVLVADANGALVDGDQIMAAIALAWSRSGRLSSKDVVATVMSNLGFERYLGTIGLSLIRTQVGDRYVVERMRDIAANLGGEQSGHIIMSDFATTGDGLIAALQVLALLVATGRPADEVCRLFEPLPQLLKNVAFNGAADPLGIDGVQRAIAAAEAKLERSGRVLIRKSGTEPLIRIMAEGEDAALIGRIVDDIVGEIERVCRI